ncbi:hypothetical protein BGZ94_008867 [Podila epigama]|nr:hypothetical protein BGZ94_008867 [Podila epigama]
MAEKGTLLQDGSTLASNQSISLDNQSQEKQRHLRQNQAIIRLCSLKSIQVRQLQEKTSQLERENLELQLELSKKSNAVSDNMQHSSSLNRYQSTTTPTRCHRRLPEDESYSRISEGHRERLTLRRPRDTAQKSTQDRERRRTPTSLERYQSRVSSSPAGSIGGYSTEKFSHSPERFLHSRLDEVHNILEHQQESIRLMMHGFSSTARLYQDMMVWGPSGASHRPHRSHRISHRRHYHHSPESVAYERYHRNPGRIRREYRSRLSYHHRARHESMPKVSTAFQHRERVKEVHEEAPMALVEDLRRPEADGGLAKVTQRRLARSVPPKSHTGAGLLPVLEEAEVFQTTHQPSQRAAVEERTEAGPVIDSIDLRLPGLCQRPLGRLGSPIPQTAHVTTTANTTEKRPQESAEMPTALGTCSIRPSMGTGRQVARATEVRADSNFALAIEVDDCFSNLAVSNTSTTYHDPKRTMESHNSRSKRDDTKDAKERASASQKQGSSTGPSTKVATTSAKQLDAKRTRTPVRGVESLKKMSPSQLLKIMNKKLLGRSQTPLLKNSQLSSTVAPSGSKSVWVHQIGRVGSTDVTSTGSKTISAPPAGSSVEDVLAKTIHSISRDGVSVTDKTIMESHDSTTMGPMVHTRRELPYKKRRTGHVVRPQVLQSPTPASQSGSNSSMDEEPEAPRYELRSRKRK